MQKMPTLIDQIDDVMDQAEGDKKPKALRDPMFGGKNHVMVGKWKVETSTNLEQELLLPF